VFQGCVPRTPLPTPEQVAHYRERGWLAIEGVLDADELAELRRHVEAFAANPVTATPSYGDPIVQGMLELMWLEWRESAWHAWTCAFAEALQGVPVDYWYNQLLLKPPRVGMATGWHQDEALMGARGEDLLISAWLTLDDVDADSGCMHFEDGGHRHGLRAEFGTLSSPERAAQAIDPARIRPAPLRAGGMTFHHGKMPHMTLTNTTERWRNVVIQRFAVRGAHRPTSH
jgi:ectoine hydroxylase-related dioxygenase (phytanoyl-CoA dioxygenase family)